jgi:integrase
MGKLTALKVKNAKPGRHVDGQGLMLMVRAEGSRSWVLRVQVNGRRRDFGLGSTLSLLEAREKAARWRKLAKEGIDPSAEARRAIVMIPSFAEAARAYHADQKAGWKSPKHAAQWLKTLEVYAFAAIGSKTVDAIDASDMWSVLGPIWQDKPEQARRVRQRMGTVLDFAKAKGWRDTDAPMRALTKISSRQRKKAGNLSAMPYAEIPTLMRRLGIAEQTMGRRALQFQLLNASRSGEVRGASWDEIDLERAEWKIPAERMKGKAEHIVPLSASAVAILRDLAELIGKRRGELVFAGAKGKPLSDMTLGKAFKADGGGGYTVHGTARSGFRDWVAEQTTFPGEWAEAALAHAVPNKVEAAYRRTKFLEQRRKLMAAWADYLVGRSSVITLAVTKAALDQNDLSVGKL